MKTKYLRKKWIKPYWKWVWVKISLGKSIKTNKLVMVKARKRIKMRGYWRVIDLRGEKRCLAV